MKRSSATRDEQQREDLGSAPVGWTPRPSEADLVRDSKIIEIHLRMRTCHKSLSRLFGEQFFTLVQQPIQLLRVVMRQKGLNVVQAAQRLAESAVETDPHGSAVMVMWLMAAAVEMADDTANAECSTTMPA